MTKAEIEASVVVRRLQKLFRIATPYVVEMVGLIEGDEGVQLTLNIVAKGRKGNFEVKRRVNFQIDDEE